MVPCGIHLNKHLNNVHLHPTITELYSTANNPDSLILKRFHHILPNIAMSSCPPTTPRTDLADYFLSTLSPHSAREHRQSGAIQLRLQTRKRTPPSPP